MGHEKILNRQVVSLLIISVSFGFDFMMFLSAAPVLMTLAGGESIAGYVTSILLVTAVVTRWFYSRIPKRIPARAIGITGLSLMLVGALLMYVVNTTLTGMLIAAFIRGIGFGWLAVLIQAMVISHSTPTTRGRVLGIMGVAGTLSGVLGPFIGLAMLDAGWESGPGTVAAGLAVFAILLLLTVTGQEETPQEDTIVRRKYGDTMGGALRDGVVSLNALVLLLSSVAWAGVASFLPLILTSDDTVPASVFLLIYFSSCAATRWAAGQLQDRVGMGAIYLVPAVIGVAASMALIVFTATVPTSILAALLVGVAMGIIQNYTFYALAGNQDHSLYVMTAVWTNGIDTGGLIGTVVLTAIALIMPTSYLPLVIGGIVLIALLPSFMLIKREKQQPVAELRIPAAEIA